MQKEGLRKELRIAAKKAAEAVRPLEALVGRALDAYSRLQPRERTVVAVLAAVAVAASLIGGLIGPLVHYRSVLDKSIATKDAQLRKIHEMAPAIRGLRSQLEADRKNQGAKFTLFGFLEDLAVRLSINDRIEYMKPLTDTAGAGQETVEVKIRGLYMEDLVGLLHGIEASGQPIMIKNLTIKRQEKDANLDVTFQVVFYG